MSKAKPQPTITPTQFPQDPQTTKNLALIRSLTQLTGRRKLKWERKEGDAFRKYLRSLGVKIKTKAAGKMTVFIHEVITDVPHAPGRYDAIKLVVLSPDTDQFEFLATPTTDPVVFPELAALWNVAFESVKLERTKQELKYLENKRKREKVITRGIDEIIQEGLTPWG